MPEAPGTSDLMNSPDGAQPELSRGDAFSRRVELGRTPEFRERLEKGDANAIEEVRHLNSVIVKPNFVNLGEAEQARVALETEQRIEFWRTQADLPPEVEQQLRENRPISLAERRLAEAERQRLMKDREWVKSYMEGSRAARTKMALLSIVLGSPVERTK